LHGTVPELLTVENSEEQFHAFLHLLSQRPGFHFLHHPADPVPPDAPVAAFLGSSRCHPADHFYRFLADTIQATHSTLVRLLFVDNDRLLRALALLRLHRCFDVMVFPDSQPEGVAQFRYDLFLNDLPAGEWLSLTLKTFPVYTDVLVRRSLSAHMPDLESRLAAAVKEETVRYCAG